MKTKTYACFIFSICVMAIIGLWLIAPVSLHGTSKQEEIKLATESGVSKELTENIHFGYINRDSLTTLVNTIGQMNNRNIKQQSSRNKQSYCVDNFETHFFGPDGNNWINRYKGELDSLKVTVIDNNGKKWLDLPVKENYVLVPYQILFSLTKAACSR